MQGDKNRQKKVPSSTKLGKGDDSISSSKEAKAMKTSGDIGKGLKTSGDVGGKSIATLAADYRPEPEVSLKQMKEERAKWKAERKKLSAIRAELRKEQEKATASGAPPSSANAITAAVAWEAERLSMEEDVAKQKRKVKSLKSWVERLEEEKLRLEDQLKVIDQRQAQLDDRSRDIEAQKHEWEVQKKMMIKYHFPNSKRVRLNVGGELFTTTYETLRSCPDSMLAAMFSGRFEIETDEEGCAFIDRDPTHFRLILNFLRVGATALPENNVQLEELLHEAHFYQLSGLVAKVLDKLQPYQIEWRIPYHRLREVKQKGLWYGDKWTLHNIDWHVAIETPVAQDRRHICVWVGTKGHEYPVEYQKDTALRFTSSCRVLDQTGGEDHVVSHKQDITLLSPSRWKGHDFDFEDLHLDAYQYLTIQVRVDSFAWQKKLG